MSVTLGTRLARGGVAAVAVLLIAPCAWSQALWFDWRPHPGSQGSQVKVSDDALQVFAGMHDDVGTFLGVTAITPIAGQVTTDVFYHAHEVDGHVPVFRLGDELTVLPETGPVIVDVPAGATFGFGLLVVAPLGDGDVGFSSFTFAPAPQAWPGADDDSAFGAALATLGDLNGDGVDDLAVGAPSTLADTTATGRVVIVSGADGSALLTILGDPVADGFGSVVASAGDVDGDGRADVAVGAPLSDLAGTDAGLVRVHSSADGALLLSSRGAQAGERFGAALAGLGDLDGDGRPELAVGAPGADGNGIDAGRAVVLRTADGTTLFEVAGPKMEADLGWSVAGAGDLDGDGVGDVLLGAPGEDFDAFPGPGAGTVRLHSGATGALLFKFKGETQGGRFGQTLAAGADFDGDGAPDLLVGEAKTSTTHALSGATKLPLFEVPFAYRAPAITPDLDGDARPDFAIGSAATGDATGRMTVYSGRDGARLAAFHAAEPGTGFGFAVCSAGDTDGDGLAEIAVGAPGAAGAAVHAGALFVHALFVHWFDLGHALAGVAGSPRLQGHGLPYAGMPISLALTTGPRSSLATLVIGTSQIDLPFMGGVMVPSLDRLVGGLVTDTAGVLELAGTWPAGLPAGLQLYLQIWIVEPAGPASYSASNGLRVTVP